MNIHDDMLGSEELAAQLGGEKLNYRNGIQYKLAPEADNSWLVDIHPAPGLFVTRAYFKPVKSITINYTFPHNCLWLCSFDSGNLTITEKGKKARQLQPGMHLIVHHGQSVKVTFTAPARQVYTSIMICDHFIATYFKDRHQEQLFTVGNALSWNLPQYDTPEIMLVFDQLKCAVLNAQVALVYYESKAMELLSIIQRNHQHEMGWKKYLKSERKNHLSYQNRKYIWLVKAELDRNILMPPKLDKLAILAEMSVPKLYRCFKQWYGMTIADYVREEKMKYAMRLLWSDELSIKNIAETVGYESHGKFTAAFKKVHGFTPSQFRKSFGL
jgi:AraC-like DNA-binding protein